jgi:hypothetical protein
MRQPHPLRRKWAASAARADGGTRTPDPFITRDRERGNGRACGDTQRAKRPALWRPSVFGTGPRIPSSAAADVPVSYLPGLDEGRVETAARRITKRFLRKGAEKRGPKTAVVGRIRGRGRRNKR